MLYPAWLHFGGVVSMFMGGFGGTGIVIILLQVVFAVHAVRRGQIFPWVWIIVFVPFLGCLIYFIAILLPELTSGHRANRFYASANRTLDFGRRERALQRRLDIAPTVQNRMSLAEEYMRRGNAREAAELYRESAAGLGATDSAVLYGLIRALFAAGDEPGALDTLETLRQLHPDFRRHEVQLLYGRALAAAGRNPEALEVLHGLAEVYPGEEARYRYGELLARAGETGEAAAQFQEIIRRIGLQNAAYRRAQKPWYEGARRALA